MSRYFVALGLPMRLFAVLSLMSLTVLLAG